LNETTWRRGAPLYTFTNGEQLAISSGAFESDSISIYMIDKPASYSTIGGFVQIGDSLSYTKGDEYIYVFRNGYKYSFKNMHYTLLNSFLR